MKKVICSLLVATFLVISAVCFYTGQSPISAFSSRFLEKEAKKSVYLGKRRNLIIIHDQYNETDGSLNACTLVLLRALQAENSLILVSSSVWANMLSYVEEHGNEHFLQPDEENWELYRVTEDIVLAIPKEYLQKIAKLGKNLSLNKQFIDKDSGNTLTSLDVALGLKLSLLSKIVHPFQEDVARSVSGLFGHSQSTLQQKSDLFASVVAYLLVNPGPSVSDDCPAWDIFLIGHGKNPTQKGKKGQNKGEPQRIAGFSKESFKLLLSFFNDRIPTHLFMYQTCFGGGKSLTDFYTTDNKPDIYNFDIISCCTASSPSSVMYNPFSVHTTDFKQIFKALDDDIDEDNLEKRVKAYLPAGNDKKFDFVLENIPSIRKAGQDHFSFMGIDKKDSPLQLYSHKKLSGDSLDFNNGLDKNSILQKEGIIVEDRQALLLEDNLLLDYCVTMRGQPAAFIPLCAGDLVLIEKIDASDILLEDLLLYSFFPITMPGKLCDAFLIKELICKDEHLDTPVVLNNVSITTSIGLKKRQAGYRLLVNGVSDQQHSVCKLVTYQKDGCCYSLKIKPKSTPFLKRCKDFVSKAASIGSLVKIGISAGTGQWWAMLGAPASLLSLTSSSDSHVISLKRKKMWQISSPKLLSDKKAQKYLDRYNEEYNAYLV